MCLLLGGGPSCVALKLYPTRCNLGRCRGSPVTEIVSSALFTLKDRHWDYECAFKSRSCLGHSMSFCVSPLTKGPVSTPGWTTWTTFAAPRCCQRKRGTGAGRPQRGRHPAPLKRQADARGLHSQLGWIDFLQQREHLGGWKINFLSKEPTGRCHESGRGGRFPRTC